MIDTLSFLARGGIMGERIRAADWTASPLGSPDRWRPGFKAMLRYALSTSQPAAIFWGPQSMFFHNDAYGQSLGAENTPRRVGLPGNVACPGLFERIAPQIDIVMSGGAAGGNQVDWLPLGRPGRSEQARWGLSLHPIDDAEASSGVGGVLVLCSEITERGMAAREINLERERFVQLFDQSPGFMAVLRGPEHRFEFVNPSYLRLVGGRDVIGKTVAQAFPEVAEQGYVRLLDQAFATGVAFSTTGAEIMFQDKPGAAPTKRFIDFVYQPIRDAEGNVTGTFVEGVDVTGRLASDEALLRSEEQLRLATESSEVGLWDVDVIADKLYWPPRVKVMFGIAADVEVSMADFYAGLHPDDQARTIASYAAACDPAVRGLYDAEFRTIGKDDGVIRWIAAKGRGLFNERGQCIRVIGTAIDITARKLAAIRESFLRELLDRLRHLSEPEAIIAAAIQDLGQHLGANRVGYGQVQDDDTTIVLSTCYANGVPPITGEFQVDGFGAHNIARQRLGETVVVDDIEADPRNDFELWAGIETRAYVSVPLVRGGRFRASLFVNHRQPHAWDGHEVALIEDVARRLWDAVDRARAEEALRLVNASLEQQVSARTRERDRIWRLSPVVMVVGDQQGRLIEANPAWMKSLGWSLEATLNRDVMDFVAPADRDAAAAGMAQLFEGRPVVEYKLGFLHKNGERRTIAWTTVPEGDRLYGFGRDITEQTLAEELLRQSQKMDALGQLTGGIAHDFNNLLQGVIGSFDLIRRKPADRDSVLRWAAAGLHAAERGSRLTSKLLAFSRAQELELKSVSVPELVRKMSDMLDRTLGPNLRLTLDLGQPDLFGQCDPTQLEMAILNLAINARDAMDAHGELTIRLRAVEIRGDPALRDGGYIELSVSDTGKGMPPDVVARAFDPFFTTKGAGKGTGLGLSQVYASAQQAGGTARIQSASGEGTVVRMYLPRTDADDSMAEHGDRARPSRPARAASVLVVDDDPDVRNFLVASLNSLGYATRVAEDGYAGLAALEQARPDAMILDFAMPGISGAEVARMARARHPDLPIIFASGHFDTAAIADIEGTRTPMLRKPFRVDELEIVLGQCPTLR